jgi:AcrR family transcriptional regulator
MTDFTGRILPLLWRRSVSAPDRKTGRPARLTIDEVVTTGIRIADAEGLDAASMARVATELSVGTMTLYGYVPSRPELIDLMVDDVLAARDLLPPDPGTWRSQIRTYAERTFTIYREHPWLARTSHQRPPIGPGMLADQEYVLAAVSSLALPTAMLNTAALTIASWITGAARNEAESILLRRATGQTTDDWWLQRNELWEKWFDVESHPALTALWNAGGFTRGADEQAHDAYELGLTLLLDGIEAAAQAQHPAVR